MEGSSFTSSVFMQKKKLQARQNIWGLGISPLLFFQSGESGWLFPSNRLSLLDLKMFRRVYFGIFFFNQEVSFVNIQELC